MKCFLSEIMQSIRRLEKHVGRTGGKITKQKTTVNLESYTQWEALSKQITNKVTAEYSEIERTFSQNELITRKDKR